MATTQILNLTLTLSPPTLIALRLAPLLGTSCSFVHAYMELITTSAFLHAPPLNNRLSVAMSGIAPSTKPATPDQAEQDKAKSIVIPIWMANFFNRGVWSVIGLNSVTLYSALTNLVLFPEGLGEWRNVWVVGTIAASAHYVFVPLVAPSVSALYRLCVRQQRGEIERKEKAGKGEEEKSAEGWIREWRGVHRVRMFSVDLVALGCFAAGVVGVLSRGL